MKKIKDKELLDELQKRFDDNERYRESQNQLIHQLEMVNKKLNESESLKTNFLSNIKNELKNPLSSTLGLAKALMDSEGANPDFTKKASEHIYNELSNLNFQLKNIFSAAEIEAGEAIIEVGDADITALINNLIEDCSFKIKEKALSVFINYQVDTTSASVSEFKTDASKLETILLNLLLNAIQFSLEGGDIEITVGIDDSKLSISIIDKGIGIEETNKIDIFNRFFQLDMSTTKAHKGNGLGLAVTKGLVELIGGTIVVESNGASGSKFTLSLLELKSDSVNIDVATNGNEFIFRGHEKF